MYLYLMPRSSRVPRFFGDIVLMWYLCSVPFRSCVRVRCVVAGWTRFSYVFRFSSLLDVSEFIGYARKLWLLAQRRHLQILLKKSSKCFDSVVQCQWARFPSLFHRSLSHWFLVSSFHVLKAVSGEFVYSTGFVSGDLFIFLRLMYLQLVVFLFRSNIYHHMIKS